ncbi:MAG: metal-dependent transcriptional regulator, partial [Clostridia bacterium]|nr:metal-dependent transcriptional regulator [Clostridia bacterium]
GLLKTGGYVTADKDGYLSLTEVGLETAEKILVRHKVITEYLIKLGVSADTASNDACKIEHVISDESFNAIKNNL